MKPPSKQQIQSYLTSFSEKSAKEKKRVLIDYFGPLEKYGKLTSKSPGGKETDLKKMGYGSPYLIVYREVTKNGTERQKKAILSTMRVGFGFGHDYRADRVDNAILSYDTWNSLPQHCRVWDVGAFDRGDSSLVSLGQGGEFFLLRPMIQGTEYYKDLDRIFEIGRIEEGDLERARSLATYLSKIHKVKYAGPGQRELYARKIRDTIGHGECIFGLADSYPSERNGYMHEGELEEIEKKSVTQRWKLKDHTERLSKVHGDFHPWNILFQERGRRPTSKFKLLDRSRGEWGEPADDVCALSINYLFYSLRKYGAIKGIYLELFDEFMKTYLDATNDNELPAVMPLFYVFRALVIASPIWYPQLDGGVRRKIFNFAQNLLDGGSFEYSRVNDYFGVHHH